MKTRPGQEDGETRKTALMMTATVEPPSQAPHLARVDVESRVNDYARALRFNLELVRDGVIDRLLFVDNSGYGTEPFDKIVQSTGLENQVELYSYEGNEAIESQSRLYGECKLMEQALTATKTLGQKQVDHFWKITGRYTVRNIASILKKAPTTFDLCIHCRDYPNRYVDFGFVGFSLENAQKIFDRIFASKQAYYLNEIDVRDMVADGEFDGFTVVPRLPRVPDFSGVRGYDNKSYDGITYRMKHLLRVFANRTMPGLWI